MDPCTLRELGIHYNCTIILTTPTVYSLNYMTYTHTCDSACMHNCACIIINAHTKRIIITSILYTCMYSVHVLNCKSPFQRKGRLIGSSTVLCEEKKRKKKKRKNWPCGYLTWN